MRADENSMTQNGGDPDAGGGEWRALLITVCLAALSAALMAMPTPAGLSEAGKRVLAVAVMAIGLWCTEAIPAAVTGILLIIALVLSGGVSGLPAALAGFAEPVSYFLIGVLTIGLAVSRSGLAERVARFFLRRCDGSSRALYLEMLLSFPLLTLLLPSATTRTGILIFVYEQALDLGHVPRGAPLAKAVMLALGSVNRLASTVLLTGGITPVLAASLIGGISWGRWFMLMSIPYGILLAIGAAMIYLLYRKGFSVPLSPLPGATLQPLSKKEIRTLVITTGASLLWLTDAWHHWNPAMPAILAWALLLTPGIGALTWKEFEQGFGWANFFVIASSLSLARAIAGSGAGLWIAETIVRAIPHFWQQPTLVMIVMLLAATLLRLLIPNIAGFLATTIPVAMSIGSTAGLNPVVCGLAVMIAGDAVLYYPAQSASSLVVYERGHLTAPEIFRFGIWMTIASFLVLLLIAVPFWQAVGEPLLLPIKQ